MFRSVCKDIHVSGKESKVCITVNAIAEKPERKNDHISKPSMKKHREDTHIDFCKHVTTLTQPYVQTIITDSFTELYLRTFI